MVVKQERIGEVVRTLTYNALESVVKGVNCMDDGEWGEAIAHFADVTRTIDVIQELEDMRET